MHQNNDRRQQWFILQELVVRELKRRYARSYLGVLWSVLHPLLSMMILSFIFSSMFQRSIENYPIYYLSGYLIWQTRQEHLILLVSFTGVTSTLYMLNVIKNLAGRLQRQLRPPQLRHVL